MNVWQLECIVAAAEHKNLTSAAKDLGISQSSLSRTIANVSKELGAPLFMRGHHLILTDVGRQYVKVARQIIEIKQQTYRQIQSMDSHRTEQLTIGLSPHLDSSILLKMLEGFQKEYPYLRVTVTEAYSKEATELVSRNKLDISVGIQSSEMEGRDNLRFIPALWITYLVALSEINPLAAGGAASRKAPLPVRKLSDFRDIPFIGMDQRALGYGHMMEFFHQAGVWPIEISTAAQISFSKVLARDYNAYACIPIDSCEAGIGLRYFTVEPELKILKGFYVRKHFQITPMIAAFLERYAQAMSAAYPDSVRRHPVVYPEGYDQWNE